MAKSIDDGIVDSGCKAESIFCSKEDDAEDGQSKIEAWSEFDIATDREDAEDKSMTESGAASECSAESVFLITEEEIDILEHDGCDGWAPVMM